MGGRQDCDYTHYETEKIVCINGLTSTNMKCVMGLLRKANFEQLRFLSDQALKERLKRCAI